MTVFLTAEEILTVAERRATWENPAVIAHLDSTDIAEFRDLVRHATAGYILHIPSFKHKGRDSFACVGRMQDDTPLFLCDTNSLAD